ncbi:hypothetical protein E4U59_005893 [Claviceps monticola]|nr:hypothetical protein E4U59_005893 [Claviceps monticola]
MVKCEPVETVEAIHRGLKRDAAQRDMIVTVDWNRSDPQAPRPGDDRLQAQVALDRSVSPASSFRHSLSIHRAKTDIQGLAMSASPHEKPIIPVP